MTKNICCVGSNVTSRLLKLFENDKRTNFSIFTIIFLLFVLLLMSRRFYLFFTLFFLQKGCQWMGMTPPMNIQTRVQLMRDACPPSLPAHSQLYHSIGPINVVGFYSFH
jgi:hypothetical protein